MTDNNAFLYRFLSFTYYVAESSQNSVFKKAAT